MNLLNKQIFVSFGILRTQFRNILIATAILLIVVVGIAAFPSQQSFVEADEDYWWYYSDPSDSSNGTDIESGIGAGYAPLHYFDEFGMNYVDYEDLPCQTLQNCHLFINLQVTNDYTGRIYGASQLQLLDPNKNELPGRVISWGGAMYQSNMGNCDYHPCNSRRVGGGGHSTFQNLIDSELGYGDNGLFRADDCMGTYWIQYSNSSPVNSNGVTDWDSTPNFNVLSPVFWPPPGITATSACAPPQPTPTPAPTSTPSSSGASLTGTTSMSGSGNTAVQVSISSSSTSVTSDTTTPTPAPLYLRSAGATPFPSIPKYGTPIPTPSISTSQPYIMLKNPRGRYITTSEPVGTEINIVGGNFPGKSEIESMWFTPVDPPYGEPIDITPQTKYFDVWSLSYKYQKNQTDKSGVVNETIIVPDAPPGLYYIELTARKVLGTTAKTQSTLFRIPGEPDLTAPVPYAIPDPYPTSTPYPVPVQVRAQRNISFDTQTRNSMKYDIDFGPNKICSDDL